MTKRRWILLTLAAVALAIKVFSLFPEAVEKYYSNGIYPLISQAQRFILGWIPFSIGDLLYGFGGLFLVIRICLFGWKVSRKQSTRKSLKNALSNTFIFTLIVYIWFNVSWGLNYNRVSISRHLRLNENQFNAADLKAVMAELVARMNGLHSKALEQRSKLNEKRFLFNTAIAAYDLLNDENYIFEEHYPKNAFPQTRDRLFRYKYPAIKPSMYSYLGNYLGFTGYYNPFTGEAQVNTTVPEFIQPFTSCHEIGHQLGYAKENEANLAGYLSARSSADPAFLYSVYFEMYSYSRRYMYAIDSLELRRLDSTLAPAVKEDFRYLRQFLADHANPIEVIIDKLYSKYLQANEQPAGRVTYNEVVLLLVAYYRKYGTV